MTNDKLEWWQYKSAPRLVNFYLSPFFYMWWHGKQNLFPCTYLTSRQIELSEYGNVCPLSFETNKGDEWYLRALNFLSHLSYFLLHTLASLSLFHSFKLPFILLPFSFMIPTTPHHHWNTTREWMKNVFIYWKEVGTKIYYVAHFNILWRNVKTFFSFSFFNDDDTSLKSDLLRVFSLMHLAHTIISKCEKFTLFIMYKILSFRDN